MCKVLGSGRVSSSALKRLKTTQTTASAFIESNYFDIAKEVYKKTQGFNVPKKELLVEIDFVGDAPALRNEFKVWLTSRFFEGSSVADAPDWFRTHVEKTRLTRFLREENEKVTSDNLLALCRANNGLVSVARLNRSGVETACELFSDKTVEAIGSEDYDRMVAYLGQHAMDEYFSEKRKVESGST
jgi:hypothetical protein